MTLTQRKHGINHANRADLRALSQIKQRNVPSKQYARPDRPKTHASTEIKTTRSNLAPQLQKSPTDCGPCLRRPLMRPKRRGTRWDLGGERERSQTLTSGVACGGSVGSQRVESNRVGGNVGCECDASAGGGLNYKRPNRPLRQWRRATWMDHADRHHWARL